jgi:hypothetical protein
MKTSMKITATMVLFTAMIIYGCKKKSAPPFPLNYTSKMGGIRPWSGLIVHSYVDTSVIPFISHLDSAYITDTFAVVVIDDKTIQMPNILHDPDYHASFDLYYQYDSTNAIAFWNYFTYSLVYNYQNNTIAYFAHALVDTTFGVGEYNLYLHSQ